MQRQRQQPRSPRRRPATERRFRIGVTTFLLVAAVVAVGATVQGIVGFGLNLIAAPLVGIVEPRLVPSTMVVVAMPLYWSMARRERHAIDWPLIGWISVGRLPGIAVGAALVSRIPHDRLSVLVGAVVVAAAALSFAAPDVSTTPVTAMTAGLIAGAMDTTAAVGGPPLALLTQHRAAAEIRSTLAVAFPIGTVLSIAALARARRSAQPSPVASAPHRSARRCSPSRRSPVSRPSGAVGSPTRGGRRGRMSRPCCASH